MTEPPDAATLSTALIIWTGWGLTAWPQRDEQRLASQFRDNAAAELLPQLRALADDFYASNAWLTAPDLVVVDLQRRPPASALKSQRQRCHSCSCNAGQRPVGFGDQARHTPRRPLSEGVFLNIVRRALATVAIGSSALAGVAVIGVTAAQAAKVASTSLSITAPHQVTYGQPAKVTGDLTNTVTHKGLSGLTVLLRERRPGATKWTVVGTAITSPTGSVSLSTPPLKLTEQVQLVHPKTAATQATTSAVNTIKVAYAVTAGLNKDTVTVTVAPSAVGQTAQLQKLGKAGWATVQTGKLGAGSSTTFTIKPPKVKGSYRYRVVKPASRGFLQGTSATLILVV